MVSIKTSYTKMQELLGMDVSIDELGNLLAYAKSEIDDYVEAEDMLVIDIKTSNRPDLWSAEGMVREIKGILEKEAGIPTYEVKKSDYKVIVDPKLVSSRPYIACAIVKNLKLTDYSIKQFMQHSEKIDNSYGRKRNRSSIGMYNLSMIQSPVEYKVIDKKHKFIPLGYEEEMDLPTILDKHEKGLEFGDIVKGYGLYPILLSANGTTLSLPPVINSNDVGRVTEETKELLIEVTGTNYETVNVVLNILCQTMIDYGAFIYSVEIVYPPEIHEKNVMTPIIEHEMISVDLNQINKYLGVNLTPKQGIRELRKRRFECETTEKSNLLVSIPPYRKDILHWVDIAEEIAIALDYNKIDATKWKVITEGGLLPETESENIVRNILVGSGGIEVLTNTLTGPEILTKNVNLAKLDLVELQNPVSLTYSVLRNQLFPILISVLSRNTHETYPQLIFEVGEVVKILDKKVATQSNAAFAFAGAEASFEECHKRLHMLLDLLNAEYKIESISHPSFTEGRSGKIVIDGKECGIIGEIHPSVLEINQIWVPIVVFEIELPFIPALSCEMKFTY
ncbi:MAG: phenylalanine--tRNA ligase subunit beta [Candidatus Heimdallarchaeota archaeon]|nr:phenylalanine--tRNA ligase subunit beta [Candidatus Heimdallarchaeota archaeon]